MQNTTSNSDKKISSPENVECEHFEESNSKIHNGILLLAPAYHMNIHKDVHKNVCLIVQINILYK